MPVTYSVTLTDAEVKALAVVALDPAEWVRNAVKDRARVATDEIVRNEIARRFEAGEPIPQTKDEIVMDPKVKTAAEREAERNVVAPATPPAA